MVEMLAERTEIDEGTGTEPGLTQCNTSHVLHIFLESESKDTWQGKEFLEELLAEIREETEDEQKDNSSETQGTTDVRTTL